MLSSLLWTVCGALAALVAAFRVQLGLLPWDPFSGWGGLVAGMAVGALALVLVFTTGLWKCSWLGACLLALLFLAGVLGLAFQGLSRPPNGAPADAQAAAEWSQLHPALRQAVWLAALSGEEPGLAGIAAGADPVCAPLHQRRQDGYAAAVDLRLAPAGPVRAWLRQGLFVLTGYEFQSYPACFHLALPPY
ncbi:MAG: hypothetical protein FJY95_10070 [Candidatus Handelsmanbacteria bacterium]|nr:hypothetical protein [Candidatus Handelsmanbacteria bacterium]